MKIAFIAKIGENSKFCYKSSKYQNFISIRNLLVKKGNGKSYISCKFQLLSMQIFFKMAT